MLNTIEFLNSTINRDEIPQSELNIDARVRTNLFSWNGQFSPQFVETILRKYCAPGQVILDPFAGSGTVLCEAARLGLSAYGIELNPAAYYMSKLFELCNIDKMEIQHELTRLTEDIMLAMQQEDLLFEITKLYNTTSELLKNIIGLYIVILDIYNHELTSEWVMKKWLQILEIVGKIPHSDKKISVLLSDARRINLQDNTIDFVLTSPPYINVFNYHQKYRRSVENIGFDILRIAHAEIGANRKFRSNRLYTVIQYCIDMSLAISEILRVCNQDSRIVFVIGRESTVLGYSFCNSVLIDEIMSSIFLCKRILRQERCFKNRYGQMIYEDILHYSKDAIISEIDLDDVVESARMIALTALLEKQSIPSTNERKDLLQDAIKSVEKIEKSEDVFV